MSKAKILIFVITITIFLSIAANDGLAATYTVTNTNDSGPGSLRQAILSANATADDDIIFFGIAGCPNGVCTIILTSGQLTVNASNSAGTLTVSNPSGPGNLVISGNSASRIFYVTPAASLTVDGLTMERGVADFGGGILNEGDLNVTNSVIRTCTSSNYWAGGGVANNGGDLSIHRSEIRQNTASWSGGGIFSIDGFVSIRDSTIADNVGFYGGGIALIAWSDYSWTATVVNCTLSRNAATDSQGQPAAGGAVYLANSGVPVRFINVTVTQNSGSYGGGVVGDGLVGASMYARNSVFAGNTAGAYRRNSASADEPKISASLAR